MEHADLLGKLLSHRLRGFSDLDHTPSALERACASPVPVLEVDTRVSKDGRVYLYHDASTGPDVNEARVLARTPSAEIDRLRFVNGEPLLSLQAALERFQQRAFSDQRLCLDVKDYGFEEVHLRLVRDAGLDDHVYFASWIPQTLLRLHALGAKTPLFLSHWNLTTWGTAGRLLTSLLRDTSVALGSHVVHGANRATAELRARRHGYHHKLVCQDVPDPLRSILSARGGGLCVHRSLFGEALAAYCRRHGLALWLYAVRTPDQFLRYARHSAVDGVFCDEAPAILDALT